MTPACAKACPTASIQFGPVDEPARKPPAQRVEIFTIAATSDAYLYGCDSVGDYGPLNSFFLLEDHPNEYNLPVNPPQPFRGQEQALRRRVSPSGRAHRSRRIFVRRRGVN